MKTADTVQSLLRTVLKPALKDGRPDNCSGTFTGTEGDLNTAPQQEHSPDQFSVTGAPMLTDSSDVSDLGWLIPAVIVAIFAMLGLAFACYLGVRRLELRLLYWCRENCACCCSPDEESGRLLKRDSLFVSSHKEAVRLKDFRERAPSYGVTRDRHEEYVPRRDFNPFDDD